MARHPTRSPTLRAPWAWAVVGAGLGLALALAAFAPARWLAASVERATDGRLRLETARGTIWDGSAQVVVAGGAGSRDAAALPSRLVWTLRFVPTGMRLTLAADCCTPQPLALRLRPRWGGLQVRVADGPPSQWPAAVLAGLGTPWNTLELEGDLQLATHDLAFEWVSQRLQVTGSADVSALRMASRLSTLRPMGSYRMTLSGGATPTLQLSTLEGALQLAGSGQWVGSRLRFSGEAWAQPQREAALSNLLNIIGRRNGARSVITVG